jgi:hypothetical protein
LPKSGPLPGGWRLADVDTHFFDLLASLRLAFLLYFCARLILCSVTPSLALLL